MRSTARITRDVMPDHDGSDILVYSPTGEYLGRLIFEKATSRLEQPPDLLPYRVMQSKQKYRQRR